MLDLGTFGKISDERRATRNALRDAIARVARAVGYRDGAYTHLHEQRLVRMGGETRKSALIIRAYLAFWRELFGGDDDIVRLRAFGQEIEEADLRCGHRTLDSLLELSAAVAIARAAMETRDVADLPHGIRWEIVDVDERDERNVPSMVLRSGALSCSISKKAPSGDSLLPLLAGMGIAARGNQPDIVLTFSKQNDDGQESELVVLADAKRNATQDGKGYLATSVETAVVYAVSFGHRMGLRIHPEGQGRIDGDVLPAVSLFCRQAVTKIAGAGPRPEDIVARLRSPERLPAVMALDVDHFFIGDATPRWCPAIVGAWFGRIARESSVALDQKATTSRSNAEGQDSPTGARSVPPPRRGRGRRESSGDAS